MNKYSDASNKINPTQFIVRKRLCNYYRISVWIVSYSTLVCFMTSLKIRKGRKGQTTIYTSYTSDKIVVSVHLHVRGCDFLLIFKLTEIRLISKSCN